MRLLGIDLGSRRIGLAVSDPGGVLASPHAVLPRGRDHDQDHRTILAEAEELGVEGIVVGLPLSLDGSIGPAAAMVLDEVQELAGRTDLPVATYDERFTTVTADRQLKEQSMDSRRRRQVIDQVAAAVLLQAWLDGDNRMDRDGRGL